MKTISALSGNEILEAVKIINKGGLIAFPTDTVYGLAASAFNAKAIQKLFTAKGRDFNKAIAILIGDLSHLDGITSGLTYTAEKLASRFWPGALTLVVPAHHDLPGILSPTPTIGIRMPDHPFALNLLKATGPLATTSANISGGENPLTADDVKSNLNDRVDLIIDGGKCPGGVPSTVVDCTHPEIKIIRDGGIPSKVLIDYLADYPSDD